jgi:hypothetical protein
MTEKTPDEWLNNRQKLLKITKTTTTPTGQTLDWVPIESQIEGKPLPTPPPDEPSHIPVPSEKAKTGIDFDIGEAGPVGHVPILRPDITGKTLDELVAIRHKGGKKKPTDPNPFGYFHAKSVQWSQVYGCDARLNIWDPKINIPSSPGDDHSISQLWLQNYQKPELQSIEAGWTVDKGLNGDEYPHLFIYYTTNGYSKDGNNIGGYNRLESGWVQYNPTIYPNIPLTSMISVQGGKQYDLGVKYQLYEGNWWFGINYNESGPWIWIGYYPASLFNGGLGNYVEWISFGGEVYSALPNPCLTQDQMGSGRQAAAGWTNAAYQRNLRIQLNPSGAMVNFNGGPEVDTANNCPNNPYTIQCFMNSGINWYSYQYYGGPSP